MQRIFESCQIEGCSRPHKARGYCSPHYQRHLRCVPVAVEVRQRDMMGPETCTEVGCDEPVKAKGICKMHYARHLRHGHTVYRDRKKPPKPCSVEGCDMHLYAKGLCHVHYQRAKKRMGKFGMTTADVDAMLKAQGGSCAICAGTKTRIDGRSGRQHALALDHCHTTGEVRGLLCDGCNRSIGLMADDPERIEAGAAYIRHHTYLHSLPARTLAADGSPRDYLTLLAAPAVGPAN